MAWVIQQNEDGTFYCSDYGDQRGFGLDKNTAHTVVELLNAIHAEAVGTVDARQRLVAILRGEVSDEEDTEEDPTS